MEAIAGSSTQAIIYFIMMLMGYAIVLSYVFIAIAKKEIKYLRKENESNLKRLEERMETKHDWIQRDLTNVIKDFSKSKRE